MTPSTMRRKWTPAPGWGAVPAKGEAEGQVGEQTADRPSVSERVSKRGAGHYLSLLFGHLIVFGILAALFRSRFPIDLGVFLFLTDDDFIAWVFDRTGIRIVPDSLGANFIRFFAWLIGLAVLLTIWRTSAPAWLSPWLPPPATWWMLAVIAAGIAVFETATSAVIKKLLPVLGIAREGWWRTMTAGLLRLLMLGIVIGLVYLLGSTSMLPNWFAGH